MAEFIDVIAQLRFDLAGDDRLADVVTDLDKATTDATKLQARISGLKDALKGTNNEAKRGVIRQEIKKAETQMAALQQRTVGVTKELDKAGKEASGLSTGFGKIGAAIGAIGAGFSLLEIGNQIITVTSQFQKFEAVLTNLTGDNGEAKRLISTFAEFAAETPFQVEEVIGAYVRLRNTGITPTVENIRQLGDLASASGKDLAQLAEALVDAQVGENERLKEFGIRAQKAGDVTRFTFRGVTTEVRNTSAAITEYITKLGDVQGVAGSNAAISATLGGQISNLKDQFSLLFLELGNIGAPVLTGIINLISNIVKGTKDILKNFREIAETNTGLNDILTELGAGFGTPALNAAIVDGLQSVRDAAKLGGQDALDALNIVQRQLSESLLDLGDNGGKLAAIFGKKIRALRESIEKQLADSAPKVADATTEAEKKRLESIADITDALLKLIADNNDKLALARLKGAEESIDSIRQANAIALKAELRGIDERQKAIQEKLGGAIPANILALLNTIRQQTNAKFELELQQDISEFTKKKAELLAKFTADLTQARVQAEIQAITASGTTATAALIRRAELELVLDKAQLEEQKAQKVNEAIKAGADVNEVNELYRQLNLNAEKEYYVKIAKIRQDETLKGISDIKAALDIEVAQTTDAREKQLLEAQIVQRQIAAITSALFTETDQTNIDAYNQKLKELRLALIAIEQALPTAQPQATGSALDNTISQLQSYRQSYAQLADTVQTVNDFIVRSEIEKVDALIAQQQRRVSEAQALADRGNAEALENERNALESLQADRERIANRQRRLNALLQASNYALALSQAILGAIDAANKGGGFLSPATVAAYVGALSAGTGLVLSLISGLRNTQAFAEGTPFVSGKRGVDNVPAWLSHGERVVTVKDNEKYGKVFDYITQAQPNPAKLLQKVKGVPNFALLTDTYNNAKQAERERILSKALLGEITGMRGNMELLLKETAKQNTGGRVTIVNAAELADRINENNKRWKI